MSQVFRDIFQKHIMGKTALKHDLDKYFRYASSNVAWINFNLVFNEWSWTGKLKKIAAATIDWNDNKKNSLILKDVKNVSKHADKIPRNYKGKTL